MWQKNGDFIKEQLYTSDCNHLCRYSNLGPGMVQEIKLMRYVNAQQGIMIKFSQVNQAIQYKDYLIPINQHHREAIQQQENIVMIRTRSPVYLASFLLGLNRITSYPEVAEIESLILKDLEIDLTEVCNLAMNDEPIRYATFNQLLDGLLLSLAAKDGKIFENKPSDLAMKKYSTFFSSVKENKDIDNIVALSPR